jgi:hypothetical protein
MCWSSIHVTSCLFLSRPLHAPDHEEDHEQQETHDGSAETEVPIEVKNKMTIWADYI